MCKVVCVSTKTLFEEYGNDLSFSSIRAENDYYDLIVDGQVVCMDGEECSVLKHVEDKYILCNLNGEYGESLKIFALTEEEFNVGVFQ